MPLCNNVTKNLELTVTLKNMYIYRHFLRDRRKHTQMERKRNSKRPAILAPRAPCPHCIVPTNKLAHFR